MGHPVQGHIGLIFDCALHFNCQISEEMYEEMAASRSLAMSSSSEETTTTSRVVKQIPVAEGTSQHSLVSRVVKKEPNLKPKTPKMQGLRHDSPPPLTISGSGQSGGLSTDLQCYFGCDESFKKDYQLYLHLRLKHRHESPEVIKKAYAAADEEIALTRR